MKIFCVLGIRAKTLPGNQGITVRFARANFGKFIVPTTHNSRISTNLTSSSFSFSANPDTTDSTPFKNGASRQTRQPLSEKTAVRRRERILMQNTYLNKVTGTYNLHTARVSHVRPPIPAIRKKDRVYPHGYAIFSYLRNHVPAKSITYFPRHPPRLRRCQPI